MEIETVEDLANWIADKLGVYGSCKSNDSESCEASEKSYFCCRVGFMMVMEDRIRQAVENDIKLNITPHRKVG